jgi:hypothetical protein
VFACSHMIFPQIIVSNATKINSGVRSRHPEWHFASFAATLPTRWTEPQKITR